MIWTLLHVNSKNKVYIGRSAGVLQRVAGPAGPLDLKDKTVLLVGAPSGIGEALAHQLAIAGATLIIAGRDSGKLARLADVLHSKASAPVRTVRVDLADLGSIAA